MAVIFVNYNIFNPTRNGVDFIMDKGITGVHENHWRESEISHYLKNTKNLVENFCVIDDDIKDLESFKDTKLVKCNFNDGFLVNGVCKVLEIFDEQIKNKTQK